MAREFLRAIGAGRRGVEVMGAEKRWVPVGDTIRPAYRVRVHREAARAPSSTRTATCIAAGTCRSC